MEIIELPGYTEYEKRNIAKQFLIPKQIAAHGLKENALVFTDGAVSELITDYTREAGVRNLEREITRVCRKVARKIVQMTAKHESAATPDKGFIRITGRNLSQFLGPARFLRSRAEAEDSVGVATGLVYTQFGGDVLAIETSLLPSDGKLKLTLTGQLGEVMQESAQTALSYIRSRSDTYGLGEFDFNKREMHIHVPEGATPKEGPSAGITLCTAMLSALTGKPVRKDVAMTGEITLRGRVLAIGGLKEKLLAAHRTGIREIIIPADNAKDLGDLPADVRKTLTIHPVEHVDEVIRIAFREPLYINDTGVEEAEIPLTAPSPQPIAPHSPR
jgi:ATP-dependent Lon protease